MKQARQDKLPRRPLLLKPAAWSKRSAPQSKACVNNQAGRHYQADFSAPENRKSSPRRDTFPVLRGILRKG